MMLITEHDSKVTPVSGRDTQAYAVGLFGEASDKRPCTVPRVDGKVVCCRVGPGRPDGASDNRSGLKPWCSLFPLGVFF